jgi:hypothetical protein
MKIAGLFIDKTLVIYQLSLAVSSPSILQQIGEIHDRMLTLPPIDYVKHIFVSLTTLYGFGCLDLFSTAAHCYFLRNAFLGHVGRFLEGISGVVRNELYLLVPLSEYFG